MCRPVQFATLLVLCYAAQALGRAHPPQDPTADVFGASEIVIVSPAESPSFQVERSYRGQRAVGSKIDLPGFTPFTINGWQDEVPVPMTDKMRILLFLRPDVDEPEKLKVVNFGCAFFFRDVEKIDALDAMAKASLAAYQTWQDVCELPDVDQRVRGLFAYLGQPSHRGPQHRDRTARTFAELAKLKPASGDFLASQILTASASDCWWLLHDALELQSPKCHQAVITRIDRGVDQIKAYLAEHNLASLDRRARRKDLPQEIREALNVVGVGIYVLLAFHDPNDAPYVRGLIPFLLANDPAAVSSCLFLMKDHPSPANVPLLLSVWDDYKSRRAAPDQTASPTEIAYAMGAQNDNAVIPALREMLDIPQWHDTARNALRALAGKDFNTDAEWKVWLTAQSKPAAKAEPATPIAPAGNPCRCYPRPLIRCR